MKSTIEELRTALEESEKAVKKAVELAAALRLHETSAKNGSLKKFSARDSELLDAILEAYQEMQRTEQLPAEELTVKAIANTRSAVSEAILSAITERAKR